MNLTLQDRQAIVNDYNTKIEAHCNVETTWVNCPAFERTDVAVILRCREFKAEGSLPSSFSGANRNKLQYDLRSKGLGRPVARRVALLVDQPGRFDDDTMTVSHLCHNENCYFSQHLWLESLPVNKGRNGCPGPFHGCCHQKRCIRPGPYFNM